MTNRRSPPARNPAARELRTARNMRGWTQAELAERLGVSQQAVARVEDPNGNPKVETVHRVAVALGYTVMVMFGREQRVRL